MGPLMLDVSSYELSVDEIVCLGDVVGYGPNPLECLDMVMEQLQTSELFATATRVKGGNFGVVRVLLARVLVAGVAVTSLSTTLNSSGCGCVARSLIVSMWWM